MKFYKKKLEEMTIGEMAQKISQQIKAKGMMTIGEIAQKLSQHKANCIRSTPVAVNYEFEARKLLFNPNIYRRLKKVFNECLKIKCSIEKIKANEFKANEFRDLTAKLLLDLPKDFVNVYLFSLEHDACNMFTEISDMEYRLKKVFNECLNRWIKKKKTKEFKAKKFMDLAVDLLSYLPEEEVIAHLQHFLGLKVVFMFMDTNV